MLSLLLSAASSLSLVYWGFAVYGVVTIVAAYCLGRWYRRKVHVRPVTLHAHPEAWLAYWLPLAIAAEAWLLIGGGVMSFLYVSSTPPFTEANGAVLKLGIVIGAMVMVVGYCVAIDAVMVVRARRAARQQQANGLRRL